MSPAERSARSVDTGLATAEWAVAVAGSMVLLVLLANVVAFQYARGAIRTAVDEASRYGAALGRTAADCEDRASQILFGDTGLLRGSLGSDVSVDCEVRESVLVARASGELEWWFGGLPALGVASEGRSVIELPP